GVACAGGSVQPGDREPARTAGGTVEAGPDAHPRVHLDEHRAKLVLGGFETKIADEDGGRNGTPPLPSILPNHISLYGRVRASTLHSSSREKRMLPFRIPSRTTSMPPLRNIHSRRWSRYSRRNWPEATSCGNISNPAMLWVAGWRVVATLGRSTTRACQAARADPSAGGAPVIAAACTNGITARSPQPKASPLK